MDLHHIPLADIDDTALPRDRAALDPAALAELEASILATGLATPIEVLPIDGPTPFALVAGFRRMTVLRRLAASGLTRFATVPALIVPASTIPAALARMVEENDIRAEISPWDKARIAVEAADQGLFPSVEAAIDTLYASADRFRRARLRSMADAVLAFAPQFDAAHDLTQRQILRLAAAARAGMTDAIIETLAPIRPRTLSRQMEAIECYLREAEVEDRTPNRPPPAPGRPRRITTLRPGLTIRREMRGEDGWALVFSGREATSPLMEHIMEHVERWFGRG
jgi:ParB family chromosome partitioning protein